MPEFTTALLRIDESNDINSYLHQNTNVLHCHSSPIEATLMSRLTITLDDRIHRALKEAAARQGRPIGQIIEESLILRGIKPESDARSLVEKARLQAGIGEDEAIDIAVEETRSERQPH